MPAPATLANVLVCPMDVRVAFSIGVSRHTVAVFVVLRAVTLARRKVYVSTRTTWLATASSPTVVHCGATPTAPSLAPPLPTTGAFAAIAAAVGQRAVEVLDSPVRVGVSDGHYGHLLRVETCESKGAFNKPRAGLGPYKIRRPTGVFLPRAGI